MTRRDPAPQGIRPHVTAAFQRVQDIAARNAADTPHGGAAALLRDLQAQLLTVQHARA